MSYKKTQVKIIIRNVPEKQFMSAFAETARQAKEDDEDFDIVPTTDIVIDFEQFHDLESFAHIMAYSIAEYSMQNLKSE